MIFVFEGLDLFVGLVVHEGGDDFLVVIQVVFDQFVEFGLFEGLVLEFFLLL